MSISSELSPLPESPELPPQIEDNFFHFEYNPELCSVVGFPPTQNDESSVASDCDTSSDADNFPSEPNTPLNNIPFDAANEDVGEADLFQVTPFTPLKQIDLVYSQDTQKKMLSNSFHQTDYLYDSEEQFPICKSNNMVPMQEVEVTEKVAELLNDNEDLLRQLEQYYGQQTHLSNHEPIHYGPPIELFQPTVADSSIYPVLDPRLIEMTALSTVQVNDQQQTEIGDLGSGNINIQNAVSPPKASIGINVDFLNPSQYRFDLSCIEIHEDELGIDYNNQVQQQFIIQDTYDSIQKKSTTKSGNKRVLRDINRASVEVHGEFKCKHQKCDMAYFKRKSDYRKHLKSHTTFTFKCPYYDALDNHKGKDTFNRMDVWKRHLRTFHFVFQEGEDSNQGKGRCKACGEAFKLFNDFADKHIEVCAKRLKIARQQRL